MNNGHPSPVKVAASLSKGKILSFDIITLRPSSHKYFMTDLYSTLLMRYCQMYVVSKYIQFVFKVNFEFKWLICQHCQNEQQYFCGKFQHSISCYVTESRILYGNPIPPFQIYIANIFFYWKYTKVKLLSFGSDK